MREHDPFPRPKGRVRLEIYRHGKLWRIDEGDNLILDAALPAWVQAFGGRVAKIGVGTNGTAPTGQDAALTKAVTKAVDSVTYPTASSCVVAFSFVSAEANGISICELGLLDAGGVLIARRVRQPLVKTPDMTILGTWTLTF